MPKDQPPDSVFRANALKQVNVAAEVDNLLPLLSTRVWLVVAGVGIAIVGLLVFAVGSQQVTQVTSTGRAVAAPGLAHAVAPVDGAVTELRAASGAEVAKGDVVAVVEGVDGSPVSVIAPVSGQVWQELVATGQGVASGAAIATVLPAGSSSNVLIAVPEVQGERLRAGMRARVVTSSGAELSGAVTDVAFAPMPASMAADDIYLPLPDEPMVKVAIDVDGELEGGHEVQVTIDVARETLLDKFVSPS